MASPRRRRWSVKSGVVLEIILLEWGDTSHLIVYDSIVLISDSWERSQFDHFVIHSAPSVQRSSTRFTVWSRSLCWNLGMHINQGWLILSTVLNQLLQSSGPLCACWHSGLVSSATEKFSFSSGAHDLVCAPRFCLWHKCFLLFKIYDESTSCVFVTTDSQDSSPTPSVTFSLGYCKQLRSQHQSLGAWHWQVCIDNMNAVVVRIFSAGATFESPQPSQMRLWCWKSRRSFPDS